MSVLFSLPLCGPKLRAIFHTAVVTLSHVVGKMAEGGFVMFLIWCLEQVLGGAGPAIAAVPLTVVWAGGSFVTLATGLGAGKVGPVGAVQRVGYVFFMSIAQVCDRLLLSPFPQCLPKLAGQQKRDQTECMWRAQLVHLLLS